jgi:exodeoxyribonuclease-5
MIKLSSDQQQALDTILQWFASKDSGRQYITLGGYAGTGKTTLISVLRSKLKEFDKKKPLKVAFCSFTGKATRVMQQKLEEANSMQNGDSVSTIHSLIYSPLVDNQGEISGWDLKKSLPVDLIIVDEASMVDKFIWQDLRSFNLPILAVGDHGQLPPINGNFNLMEAPDIKLEKIHRQAQDNPIIKLSITARETGRVETGRFGDGVAKLKRSQPDTREMIEDVFIGFNDETLVLCGYNRTRVELNNYIRSLQNQDLASMTNTPAAGDRVICLRNNHKKQIYNGMLGRVKSLEAHNDRAYFATIEFDGERNTYTGLISKSQFNSTKTEKPFRLGKETVDLFDYGYALTVHKAQGSQARRVVLFEQRFPQMEDNMWKRWLYTGITRAEHELYLIEN